MENALLYILLVIVGTLVGIFFVLGILKSLRGLVAPAYGVPPVYRDDGTYYRDRSDWIIIFILFLLAGASFLFSDKFAEIVNNEASLGAPSIIDNRVKNIPSVEYDKPLLYQRENLPVEPDTMFVQDQELEDPEEEGLEEDKDYPLTDYFTDDFYYIQYSASGIVEFVEEKVVEIDRIIKDMVFVAIEDGKYKILSGPYLSRDEAKKHSRGCKQPNFIRTGAGLNLFVGYYE